MALTTINSGGVKDDSIVNADIKSDAAIVGTKVAPDFGSQNIVTTGTVGIGTGSGTTASAGYDEFVIHGGDADIGMNFLSPAANNKKQQISFGDSNNNQSGRIVYDHDGDHLSFGTNGTAERLHIDSSGRVLIGTTSADDVSQKLKLYQAGNDHCLLNLTVSNSSYSSIINFGDDSSSGIGQIAYAHSDDSLKFKVNGSEKFRLLSTNDTTFSSPGTLVLTGDSAYDSANNAGAGIRFVGKYDSSSNTTALAHIAGIKENTTSGNYGGAITFHVRQNGGLGEEAARFTSAGNLKFPNGHGIDFSSTTSGTGGGTSTTHETLDEYEEGTWTPADASTGGLSLSVTSASYVRVGTLVFINFYITFPSNSDGAHAYISGLPFTAQGSNNYFYLNGRIGSTADNTSIQVNAGATNMHVYIGDSVQTNSNLSGKYLLVSGCYSTG